MSSVPDWFTAAVAEPGTSHEVVVDDVAVHYLAWGRRDDPTVVLVHGGAAHARWWSHLAPLLAAGQRRVLAIDLSGHGDSGWRERYGAETWAREVLAVAADGGTGRPVVVGHSMGGFVTIVAAARHGQRLAGAMVLDSPIDRPDPESAEGARSDRGMFRAPKRYPDLATAVEHFHLVPPQPTRHPWLVDHVARHSLREVADGDGVAWTWKFDPRVFVHRAGPNRPSAYGPELARAACRLAIVTGERSAIVDDDVVAYARELAEVSPAAAAGVPFVEVPDAHHHLLLDEPLATLTAIRAVLATWAPVGAAPAEVPPAT